MSGRVSGRVGIGASAARSVGVVRESVGAFVLRAVLVASGVVANATVIPGCYGSGDEASASTIAPGPEIALEQSAMVAGPEAAALGNVRAVADIGTSFVAFGDQGAIAVTAGLVTAKDPSITAWIGAGVVPSPDDSGLWAIGIDDRGRLEHFRDVGSLEDVGARFGLGADEHATAIATLSPTSFAVAVASGLVVVDTAAKTTRRFDLGAVHALSANGTRIAAATDQEILVVEPASTRVTRHDVRGVVFTAFDSEGSLVVASLASLYREDGTSLAVIPLPGNAPVRGLVAAGARLWIGADHDLYVLEAGALHRGTGVAVPDGAVLTSGGSADLWIAGSALARIRKAGAALEQRWEREIQPIYQRVCASCHAPGGSSGIDLSTASAWEVRRPTINVRVLEQRNMPPPPKALSEDEIAVIRSWVTRE